MRHVILVVSSRSPRLEGRLALVRDAGHWPLPAPTAARALFLARKVRPSLILVDAELSDGRASALVRELRTVPALQGAPTLIVGALTPRESDALARDLAVEAWPSLDSARLRSLMRGLSQPFYSATSLR